VAALVLSVNPNLKGAEVKDLFRRACDRIDPQGGEYDAAGHSPKYGYGRLNARTAVELAQPQPRSGTTISRTFNAPIPDLQTVAFPLSIPDATPIESLTVGINLKHTYIGDLLITLRPPSGVGVSPVVLHDRAGGAAKDLRKFYDATTTPALQNVKGKNCKGVWTLQIADKEARDFGTLLEFSLALVFPAAEPVPSAPRGGVRRNRNRGTGRAG